MTQNQTVHEVHAGRQIFAALPKGKDLIAAIEALCRSNNIEQARFSVMGAVSSVTLGTYDQAQQVFVTAAEQQPYEMIFCRGDVFPQGDQPCVFAKICLADEQGRTTGGHLFSETIIYHAEIDLIEMNAPLMERPHDASIGLPARQSVKRHK